MRQLAVVFVAVLIIGLASANCPTVDTGSGTIDLNNVPTFMLSIPQQYGGHSETYQWSINLCNPVENPPAGSTGCGKHGGPGFIQEYNANGDCQQVWSTMDSAWTWNGTALNGVFTTAATSGGNPWTAYVGLNCAQSATPTAVTDVYASGTVQDGISFGFQLALSAACAGNGPAPPSPNNNPTIIITTSGANPAAVAFIVIVFVGPVIYVIVMVLYNYFRKGLRGKDLAPHPEVWKDFPFLIRDGFLFVFNKIRGLCKKGGGDAGYSSV